MPPVHSKLIHEGLAERLLFMLKQNPPAIPFDEDPADKEIIDEMAVKKVELIVKGDPGVDPQKLSQEIPIYSHGGPEVWCTWRRKVEKVLTESGINTASGQESYIISLLSDKALTHFQTYKTAQETANAAREGAAKWTDLKVLKHALNDLAVKVFHMTDAWEQQVEYMKHYLYIRPGMTLAQFTTRLNWLNQSLQYFPMTNKNGHLKKCRVLSDKELRTIYIRAKKPTWTQKMMDNNTDPKTLTLDELQDYYLLLEQSEELSKPDPVIKKNGKRKTNPNKTPTKSNTTQSSPNKQRKKQCKHCGKYHHGRCWLLDKGNNNGDQGDKNGGKYKVGSGGKQGGQGKQQTNVTKEVVDGMQAFFTQCMKVQKKAEEQKRKKKKRKAKYESDSDSDESESNNVCRQMEEFANGISYDSDSDFTSCLPH